MDDRIYIVYLGSLKGVVMSKIALFISLDVLRYKVEKTLNQFGIVDIQSVGVNMLTLASRNFIYHDIQLIIVDIDSSDFDAYAAITNLKKRDKSAQIPILVLGNQVDKSFINRLLLLGCTDYINKPIDDMTFASKVLQIIRESERIKPDVSSSQVVPLEDLKLTWSPAFETGVESIDRDHRKIIENYEKLYQLMKTGEGHTFYEELLLFLTDYINVHFENEEQFQIEIGYNLYEDHKKRHDFFKEKITSFIDTKQESVSNYDLIKLNLFVKDWLIQHIFVQDMKIGAFYKTLK